MTIQPASGRPQKRLERCLWVCGAIGTAVFAVSLLAHEPAPARVAGHGAAATRRVAGSGVGALSIPALKLSVPVLSGCTDLNLERGACHMEGSADFGGLGNAAVAGHRDKDFRPLERIQKGMTIEVSDGGTQRYRYVVDAFEVVLPEDVRVLDIHDRPELTLITCYPFHYIGSAPKRFIVHAHLLLQG